MNELEKTRLELVEYFKYRANSEQLSINPFENVKTLDLFDRLFDETKGARRINIDLDCASNLPLNGFSKAFGIEPNDVYLLTVFVTELPADFERLWAIYYSWMHDEMSADEALKATAR